MAAGRAHEALPDGPDVREESASEGDSGLDDLEEGVMGDLVGASPEIGSVSSCTSGGRKACCILKFPQPRPLVSWIIFTFVVVATGAAISFDPWVNNILSLVLASAAIVLTIVLVFFPRLLSALCCCRCLLPAPPTSIQTSGEALASAPLISQPPSGRVLYLDNIKAGITIWGVCFLSCVYLCFNSTCYFMCMFFFISGYFTPSSCDRKGIYDFVRDKFKRLGLPFAVYYVVLGPMLIGLTLTAFCGRSFIYMPLICGPVWFLVWLLVFNCAYLFVGGSPMEYKRPSFWYLLLWGFGCGFIQGIMLFTIPRESFVMLPLTIGSVPFDILFFTAGILARRGKWLEKDVPRAQTMTASVLLVLIILGHVVMDSLTMKHSHPETPNIGTGTPIYPTEVPDKYKNFRDLLGRAIQGLMGLGYGVVCMIISFVMLVSFRAWLNWSNRVTRFFSEAAYTVYIIHPWIVVPITYSYALILKGEWGIDLEFHKLTVTTTTNLGGDARVWLGWGYTLVLSQLIVWPVAAGVRKLPGLNQVL